MKFEDTAAWRAFEELGKVTFAEGELGTKVKELIAVGVAVAMRCEDCMNHHMAAAIAAGAAKAEIAEAIAVGAEMGGGPAMSAAKWACAKLEDM